VAIVMVTSGLVNVVSERGPNYDLILNLIVEPITFDEKMSTRSQIVAHVDAVLS